MEIGQLHCCMLISVLVLLPYVAAKTFSLNEAIAGETKQILHSEIKPRPSIGKPSEKFSLLKGLGETRKNRKIKRSGILAPLHHKTKYQVKNPLKSNNLLKEHKSRLKRKNQYLKREIKQNVGINQKYLPLFKSLSFLFDGILDRESRDSGEQRKSKYSRGKQQSEERGIVCKCTRKSDLDNEESKPAKTTGIPPSTSEIRFDGGNTTPESDTTTDIHFSDLKYHKKLSFLPTRDSFSIRRDSDGISAGGSPTYQPSAERYNAGTNRNGKRFPRIGESKTTEESDNHDTGSTSRNSSGSNGNPRFRGDLSGEESQNPKPVYKIARHHSVQSQSAETEPIGRNFHNSKTFNLKVGGNEKQSKAVLRDDIRGSEFNSGKEFTGGGKKTYANLHTIHSKENYEETDIDSQYSNANDKRHNVADIRPELDEESKKTGATVEERVTLQDLSKAVPQVQNISKNKTPMVTIIDGYSVARDKNGANKLAEKSIRIHS